MSFKWLEVAKRIQSIAQAGLSFTENTYDLERYQELREISVEIINEFTNEKMEKINNLFANEKGYQTPKVDVRGIVFKNNKLLMVKEKIDNNWTVPGGWADIGLSPNEVAIKEIKEESGLDVKTVRLLAVLDKKLHPHPPDIHHVYKMFILCEITGGNLKAGSETLDAQFFDFDNLPSLSTPRITASQIKLIQEFLENPKLPVLCD